MKFDTDDCIAVYNHAVKVGLSADQITELYRKYRAEEKSSTGEGSASREGTKKKGKRKSEDRREKGDEHKQDTGSGHRHRHGKK